MKPKTDSMPRVALWKLKTFLFDLYKKWQMERVYAREHPWGREASAAAPAADLAISHIADRHYRSCLDVGSGFGDYTKRVAPICDSVLGIDISNRAVAIAQQRLADLGNVSFRVANLRTFNEGPYDLIILADTLYYLGDRHYPKEFRELIEQLASLCAPNGRVLLLNYIAPWRRQEDLFEYTKLFKDAGLTEERTEVVEVKHKHFLISVLSVRPKTY
jgi:cyclopropane fatty-acyl-phospholipid synthase-like methyltransferase